MDTEMQENKFQSSLKVVTNIKHLKVPALTSWSSKTFHPAYGGTYLVHERKYAISKITHVDEGGNILQELQLPNEDIQIYMFHHDEAILLNFTPLSPQCQIVQWNLRTYVSVAIDWKLSGLNQIELICFRDSKVISLCEIQRQELGSNQVKTYNQSKVTVSCFHYPLISQTTQPYEVFSGQICEEELGNNFTLAKLNQRHLLGWVGTQAKDKKGYPIITWNLKPNEQVRKSSHVFHIEGTTNKLTDAWQFSEGVLYIQTQNQAVSGLNDAPASYTDWVWNYRNKETAHPAKFSLSEAHSVQFTGSFRKSWATGDNDKKKQESWDECTVFVDSVNLQVIGVRRQSKPQEEEVKLSYPAFSPSAIYVFNIKEQEVEIVEVTDKL